MVTDCQVRKLMKLLNEEQTLSLASAKSGMDEKTARKYRCLGKLPSEVSKKHSWRTREDSFAEIWEEVRSKLDVNSGLQAKTLFKDLQRRHPGQYQDGQLRTLQRRVKQWRALEGPPKEVFFEQRHEPGELCQSDFTNMNKLGVWIQGQPFDHLIYHFVMTYSNWEVGHGVLLGKLREPECGLSKRGVEARRSTERSPDGAPERSGPQRNSPGGVHATLRVPSGALRRGRSPHPGFEAQRERRCRAEALPAERGGGPNTDVARQSRL